MDKCWFVLRQTFYIPPEYAFPTKAGGKTIRGNLRLGDVVPSPKNIYPILTQGELPLFSREMDITSSQSKLDWASKAGIENSGMIGGGAPIAAAAGVTVDAKLSAVFKSTMNNWANFETVDTEVVQPSSSYIDQVLAQPEVKDRIDQQIWLPFFNKWTVYIVTGLMIGRTGGTVGSSESNSQGIEGGLDVDLLGASAMKLQGSHKDSTENNTSAEIQGDRVWAVRFAKIHKGWLQRKWIHTEATIGSALDGGNEEEEEDVQEVLDHEGWHGIKLVKLSATETTGELVFAMGNF
ncbi:hypothetical protein M434DRAFT_394842 [Hypoxylon sp. CO27-5]|nr:hypothetical protein M434DRAFT_394842 [Hypoxylon sp. CO27-5]